MRTERRRMPESARLFTAEELEKFPRDDRRYELVDGRLVPMSPVGFDHGDVVTQLLIKLGVHAKERKLGTVVTEVGFKLRSKPDTVRAPDVAFVRQDRIVSRVRGFWSGPPDFAVEVLSPEDRASEVQEKIEEYFRYRVPL